MTNQDKPERGSMPPELEPVIEEYRDRIYNLYKAKFEGFKKLLFGLIGFGLTFFFIFLLPFSLDLHESSKNQELIDANAKVIETTSSRVRSYQKAQKGYNDLMRQISKSPEELREFIILTRDRSPTSLGVDTSQSRQGQSPFGMQAQQLRSPPPIYQNSACRSLKIKSDAWWDCVVKNQVIERIDSFKKTLEKKVIPVVVGKGTLGTENYETVINELADLPSKFQDKLREKPRFWTTISQKSQFFNEFKKMAEEALEPLKIKENQKKLEDNLADLQAEKKALQEKENELKKQEKDRKEFLSGLQSPLGKLPVQLDQSILVFPLLMVVGFLTCSTRSGEMTRYRKEFHTLYQDKDPGKKVLTDGQVILAAPLWIEPLTTPVNALRVFLLYLPFIIFLGSLGLIGYGWMKFPLFPGYDFQAGLGVVYLVALAVFLYGHISIHRAIKYY